MFNVKKYCKERPSDKTYDDTYQGKTFINVFNVKKTIAGNVDLNKHMYMHTGGKTRLSHASLGLRYISITTVVRNINNIIRVLCLKCKTHSEAIHKNNQERR